MSSQKHKQRLFAIGGRNGRNDKDNLLATTEYFDVRTNSWQIFPPNESCQVVVRRTVCDKCIWNSKTYQCHQTSKWGEAVRIYER
mmetsp:Transcript_28305/g.49781  ORF Transcript_28305/g.49781 Transcript_28305/m.49781 type:complete len:85 (-) Transcript_28305:307-561(-)